jgi:hypothetical protein
MKGLSKHAQRCYFCWKSTDFEDIYCAARCVADPDPLYFGKPDPDPHESEKPDPFPHGSQNSGAINAKKEAMEGRGRSRWRPGGSIWSRGGSACQYHFDKRPDTDLQVKRRIRIRIKALRIRKTDRTASTARSHKVYSAARLQLRTADSAERLQLFVFALRHSSNTPEFTVQYGSNFPEFIVHVSKYKDLNLW